MAKLIVNSDIFSDLFVLEAANNHWGQVERGKKIIQQFGAIVRHNNIKAAIKFQIRDVVNFIHPSFKGNQEIRYIKKTEATKNSIQKLGYNLFGFCYPRALIDNMRGVCPNNQ